jgi:hypothetical protein
MPFLTLLIFISNYIQINSKQQPRRISSYHLSHRRNRQQELSNPKTSRLAASITDVNLDFANYLRKRNLTLGKEKGCFILNKVARNDGYVRMSISKGSTLRALGHHGGERTFYIHHLAWYATGHAMPVPVVEHLSHLCGDSRCFNPDRLHVEDPAWNNARKGCLAAARCPSPCNHAFWICKHTPKCIPRIDLARDRSPEQ